MSNHPNTTVHTLPKPLPDELTSEWRKVIFQAATPNDTRLNFSMEQKTRIPRIDLDTYTFPVFPKPNTNSMDHQADIVFGQWTTPSYDIWLEKIKICLHQETTYGCIKINTWDFGSSLENVPTNLIGIEAGEPSNQNSPLTIENNYKLISNALDSTDDYMVATVQTPKLSPFSYTIAGNSILRFGLQYAEGNAYGLKVFLIGWTLECD